jgi:two-component system, cell cycle response regulator CpdR
MSRVALVVDDDTAVLEVITDLLRDLGCEVISAWSGVDALAKLAKDGRIRIAKHLGTHVAAGVAGQGLIQKRREVRAVSCCNTY